MAVWEGERTRFGVFRLLVGGTQEGVGFLGISSSLLGDVPVGLGH